MLFVPGVTASLATFLIFGTAKSWQQYRELVTGGCGLRTRRAERRRSKKMRQGVDNHHGEGLEFERLPSLRSDSRREAWKTEEEIRGRIRMFARMTERELEQVKSAETLDRECAKGGVAVVHSVVGAGALDGNASDLTGPAKLHIPMKGQGVDRLCTVDEQISQADEMGVDLVESHDCRSFRT